jgi:hypothetical protein
LGRGTQELADGEAGFGHEFFAEGIAVVDEAGDESVRRIPDELDDRLGALEARRVPGGTR